MTTPNDRRTRPGKLTQAKPKRASEPEAPPLSITLRDIEIPPPPAATSKPVGEEFVVSDPEARPAPWLGDPEAERAAQRAARRAQVRKERLRDAGQETMAGTLADAPPSPALPTLTESLPATLTESLPSTLTESLLPTLTESLPPAPTAPTAPTPPTPTASKPAPTAMPLPTLTASLPPLSAAPPAASVDTSIDAAPKAAPSAPPSVQPKAPPAPMPAPAPATAVKGAPAALPPPAVKPSAPAILVLREVGSDPDPLCEQLRAFGFEVQVRPDPPDLPAPWPFVAVFVDQALHPADGGDAMDLCNDVRERSRLPGVLKPVLVLVADQLTPTNRVRAGLAGCNEILLGAITRGAVAKVLDTRGIALPSDARRV
ncbi:MAG TPA: hypothetical protein VFZ28_00520 [Burkholderiaceae bacterium]|nr:hypothetical protein [Burkholderiaceae bacterium]